MQPTVADHAVLYLPVGDPPALPAPNNRGQHGKPTLLIDQADLDSRRGRSNTIQAP